MLKIILVLAFFGVVESFAQTDTTPIAPYLKTREVPGFKILLTDSTTYFYKYQLKKNTPTVIVYFNPDCNHCQVEAKNLIDSINLVKNVQFVFASYAKFNEIKAFDSTYQLSKQSNIKVGRDEKYFIPSFYKVRFTPFVALYNNSGRLVKVFEGGTTIRNLSNVVKAEASARFSPMIGFEAE